MHMDVNYRPPIISCVWQLILRHFIGIHYIYIIARNVLHVDMKLVLFCTGLIFFSFHVVVKTNELTYGIYTYSKQAFNES